jgi:hypothetical protein
MNSSFSKTSPNLQLAVDSTSIGTLMDCPRKYQLSIIQGYSPREESVHLTFGTLYHEALEVYDRAIAQGATYDQAVIRAVRKALTRTWNKQLNRPWNSDHKEKNRYTLIRTIVWYLERFRADSIVTIVLADGSPAVELSFRFQTTYASRRGEPFILCGHLDRLGELDGRPWIVDRKTTKYPIDQEYFAKYSPDNQMSTYDFAGRVVYNLPVSGVIVDAAQVLVTLSRFERGFVPRTAAQQDEWYHNLGYWLRQMESYAEEGFWPMNLKHCNMYGGCPFRFVCGQTPEVRQKWLDVKYVRRIWDPLIVRGDI